MIDVDLHSLNQKLRLFFFVALLLCISTSGSMLYPQLFDILYDQGGVFMRNEHLFIPENI